jgi:hypothetical protein
LTEGRVLVVGGLGTNEILASTEVFNPTNQIWEFGSPLNQARYAATATLLSDGRVLVVGGRGPGATESAGILDTTEISVPVGPWTSIRLGDPRVGHTATRLVDGRVVVAGGSGESGGGLQSSEMFDPASDSWYVLGKLNVARSGHTAGLLPNGNIVIVGGQGDNNAVLSSAELFDPRTGGWTLHPEMNLNIARIVHTQTVIPKRPTTLEFDVLVTGGNTFPNLNTFDTSELYSEVEVSV